MGWLQDALEAAEAATAPRPMPESDLRRFALSALRRLSEPAAVLAMRPGGAVAKIARKRADGTVVQTYELPGAAARVFAERGWIIERPRTAQNVLRYALTDRGRTVLLGFLAAASPANGAADALASALAACGASPEATAAGRALADMWSDAARRADAVAAVSALGSPIHPARLVVWWVVLHGATLGHAARMAGLTGTAAARFLRSGTAALAAQGLGATP